MNTRELNELYGDSTWQQVISSVSHAAFATGNVWVVEQTSSANNAWYANSASSFNNNKTNSNQVWPVAEYDKLVLSFFEAECRCYDNKRSKLDANQFHYHVAQILPIIRTVLSGGYEPSPNKCFVLPYQVWREVFAAYYPDRIVHHFVVPYIQEVAERVHYANGNISFGNRPRQSILTATQALQERLRSKPNGIVYKFDIQGFFMNIDRTLAFKVFLYFESKFKPSGYSEVERGIILSILKRLLSFDPTKNCVIRSPQSMWKHIKPEKSLFGKSNKGLPIGNYYVQVIAVLMLAIVDMFLNMVHLVDDYSGVEDDIDSVHAKLGLARDILNALGLTMHPNKIYIQPVRHGIPFCGRFIFANRVYMGNRTVHAIKFRLNRLISGLCNEETACEMVSVFNSYSGMLKYVAGYNIQLHMEGMVANSRFSEYVEFVHRPNQIVCRLREQYRPLVKSNNDIRYLDNKLKLYRYGSNRNWTQSRLPKASKKIG